MREHRKIDRSAEMIFESALSKMKGRFEIKRLDARVGLKLLARFEELKKYESLYVHKVTELKGAQNSFILLLIEKHLTIIEYRQSGPREKNIEEVEPLLLFSVPVDMGKVFIKKETLADKIADLLYKVDIDFKAYPGFSSRYFVVAENPELVREHLPSMLMACLDTVGDMTIEINGHWGLLRSEKNLTDDLMLLLLAIGSKMTK